MSFVTKKISDKYLSHHDRLETLKFDRIVAKKHLGKIEFNNKSALVSITNFD